jgi:hypothetical protein
MHTGKANGHLPEMEVETRKWLWIYTVVYDWWVFDFPIEKLNSSSAGQWPSGSVDLF